MADIEYFYAAHSAYAYIGSALLQRIADQGRHRIVHRPYDLRAALKALAPDGMTGRGTTGSWTPARRAYFFGRELERWAEFRTVPIMNRTPTHHANDIGLPNRVLISGLLAGHDIDRLAHAVLESHWVRDADLADPPTLVRIADAAGYEGARLVAAADQARSEAVYRANTAEAIQRTVFGSPTYFVGGDMFYGQDHLEMVQRALSQPFAGHWPPAGH